MSSINGFDKNTGITDIPVVKGERKNTMRSIFTVLLGPTVLFFLFVLLVVVIAEKHLPNNSIEVNATNKERPLRVVTLNDHRTLSFFDYSIFVKAAPFLFEPSHTRSAITGGNATMVDALDGCGPSNHDDDFPTVFTHQELKNGAILLAFFIGIYCFTLLAIICDNYFLPCVERICEVLHLSQDVAAATFMAMATSAPELFVNVIGTFLTESDIGIGTVVGSSMFNTLGVAAIGSLAAATPIKVDWWPVTRDCLMYICQISILVTIAWDGRIYWYEALILFLDLFVYFVFLFSKQLTKVSIKFPENDSKVNSTVTLDTVQTKDDDPTGFSALFTLPQGALKRIFFFYTWPIRFVLQCTVPDSRKYPKLFPITFLACIIWIGSNSYMVSWMISVIGSIFGIPEIVLGLTFLAAGGCLPEAISLTIMSRRGEGSMGLSNSLGANSMNILLSLGLPWFIKTMLMGANASSFVRIESGSIVYTILCLNLVTAALFLTLILRKFTLSRITGVILMCIYLVFITLAIVVEIHFQHC